jgi:hypothetical protein
MHTATAFPTNGTHRHRDRLTLPPSLPSAAPPSPLANAHSPDFACVRWNGRVYSITPKQRRIVAVLWQAWEAGAPFVSGAYLLERADSDQGRMSALFRDSPAWQTLVVPGHLHGGPADSYCLAPPAAIDPGSES